jgi:hypothetical protein
MISGYPYLNIARKYNLEYAVVLRLADLATHGRGGAMVTSLNGVRSIDEAVLDDINAAAHQFADIRSGKIDWQTGDPIPAFRPT